MTGPSAEALQLGSDPLYAFSPLLSIYYLVREKQEREQGDPIHPPATASRDKEREKDREREKSSEVMPELAAPQAAYTNSATFEMPGEKPTGGRTRPRARTHGEDDAPDGAKQAHPPPPPPETKAEQLYKKEGTAAGLLRRFSTRKRRDADRGERDRSHPPVVQVHSPAEVPPVTPKKSFSIRRGSTESGRPIYAGTTHRRKSTAAQRAPQPTNYFERPPRL